MNWQKLRMNWINSFYVQFDNLQSTIYVPFYYLTIYSIAHMTKDDLKERFRQFSLRIINLVDNMPNTIAGNALAKQIIRSGTSPAANYRAACLAKSDKDFLNKLKMVEEEIDETQHWLGLIMDAGMINKERILSLYEESIELNRIIIKSIVSTKTRMENNKIAKL